MAESGSKSLKDNPYVKNNRKASVAHNARQSKTPTGQHVRTNKLEQYFRIIPCLYPEQIFCFASCLLKWYRLESLRQEALLTAGTKGQAIDRQQTTLEQTVDDGSVNGQHDNDDDDNKEMADNEEIRESTVLKSQEEEYEQTSLASIHLQSELLLPQESIRQSQPSYDDEVLNEIEGEEQTEKGEGEEGGDEEEQRRRKRGDTLTTSAPPYGLLNKAPMVKMSYANAQEKRSTIKLAFDTMKYSTILEKLLDETSFFSQYPELRDEDTLVLVLCYDYAMRNFQRRTLLSNERSLEMPEKSKVILPNGRVVLYPPGEEIFKIAENSVQVMCIHLAAAVARVRVRTQVNSLRNLLPEDWRKSEEITENMPLYGWYNQLLGKQEIVTNWLKENGFRRIMLGRLPQPNEYASDKHCPDVFVFNKQDMNRLVDSEIVAQKNLILQDKSSCLAVHCMLSNYAGGEEVLFVNCINIYSAVHLEGLIGNKFPLIQPVPQIRCIRPLKEDEDVRLPIKMGSKATKNSSEDFLTLLPNGENNRFIRHIFIEASDTRCAVASPIEFIEIENEDPIILRDMWTLPGNPTKDNRRLDLITKTSSILRHALKFAGLRTVTILFHSDDIEETDNVVTKVVEATNRLLLKEAEILAQTSRGTNTGTAFNPEIPNFPAFQEERDAFDQGKPSIIAKNKFIRVEATSECNGFVIVLLHKEVIKSFQFL
ncbi:unnamed protein product [Trichobilharzia szidati]|nr:unnamed protein product [Trichobilharzia szidati]